MGTKCIKKDGYLCPVKNMTFPKGCCDFCNDYYKNEESEMAKEKCIIVDLEGTITDCKHRIHYYHSKNYDPWNSLFSDDTVNEKFMDHLYGKYLENKSELPLFIIVTAKSEERQIEVEHWLKDHFYKPPLHDVSYPLESFVSYIHLRKEDDDRGSVAVKKDIVIEILKEYDIVHAFDDREDICRMYRQLGIETTLVNDHTMKMLSEPEESFSTQSKYIEVIESKKPSDYLRQSADTFEKRNAAYDSSYKQFGAVLLALFPGGLELKTDNDFKRYGLFTMMVSKIHRYSGNFTSGGHEDSLVDLSTYAAMLNEVDHD